MKILVFISLALLLAAGANAADGLYLQCTDGKVAASAYISARSAPAKVVTNECNMGVGDEPTNCREVVSLYEDKRAIVSYRSHGQVVKKVFRMRRWSHEDRAFDPRRPLFSGGAQVQLTPELSDQISLRASETNPLEYALIVIHISGHGPESENLGAVSLPCHSYQP